METQSESIIEDNKLIYQSEAVKYEEAYAVNNFVTVDPLQLADIIAAVLSEILKETDKNPDYVATVFHARSVPGVSIKDYLQRVVKCSKCSQECLILALVYIDRMTEGSKNFIIRSLNIHRLLITGVMIAAKFFDDAYYSNQYYAKVGGISNKEINILEIEFLNFINFSLYVHPVLFFKYRERLLSQVKAQPP
jgi:hypothetical protein